VIHTQDETSLQRMLGVEAPEEVRAECELRTRMYHADGNSGPLGSVALIEMVRWMGLSPKNVERPVEKVDWRQYPQDGTVRVEARFFGAWMPGRFLGFVEAGTLAVRLEEDATVKECRPDMVRLADGISLSDGGRLMDERIPDGDEDEGPDARAQLLDEEPAVIDISEESEPEVEYEDEETPPPEMAEGPRVRVHLADGHLDGVLVDEDAEERIVHINGEEEPRIFNKAQVVARE